MLILSLYKTVFFGDSIINFWSACNPWSNVIMRGNLGFQSSDSYRRFIQDVQSVPNVNHVLILLGTNDVLNQNSGAIDNISLMAIAIRNAGLGVSLCQIPPIVWNTQTMTQAQIDAAVSVINSGLVSFALKAGFAVPLDFHTPMCNADGTQNASLFINETGTKIHPNAAGYDVMTGIVSAS